MCDYESFYYFCPHVLEKLLSYCHFARTDPYHQCYGIKVIKNEWYMQILCPECDEAEKERVRKEQENGKGSGQGVDYCQGGNGGSQMTH
ncbi:hypothetical protein B0J14DRAFT_577966 [Halenospora varia]|nr:hypothetical protein B0J14DRAFT_577966 [Halenospora varia]